MFTQMLTMCGGLTGMWLLAGYIATRIHLLIEDRDPFIRQFPNFSTRNDPGFLLMITVFYGPWFLVLIWPAKLLGFALCRLLPVKRQPLQNWFIMGF